ncbi:MAG: hypothetical protein LBE34_02430 [Flavobacteriaceae bacterium]|nr:hypothetical protein [Flavobacteriaceae bacterium]
MRKCLVFIVVLISVLACSQKALWNKGIDEVKNNNDSITERNKKEYKLLEKLRCLNVSNDAFELYDYSSISPYFEGFTQTNSIDSVIFKKIRIDKNIDFYTYKYVPTDYTKNNKEFFQIKGKSILLTSIIYNQKVDLKYQNPYFNIQEVYSFRNKKSSALHRVIIVANNRTFYRNKSVNSLFIIDYNDNDVNINLVYDIGDEK